METAYDWLKPYSFKPGQSGNPKGRPPGQSIKDKVKQYLNEHPLAEEEFIRDLVVKNKHETWKMLESAPKSSSEVDIKAKIEVHIISFDDYDTSQPKAE